VGFSSPERGSGVTLNGGETNDMLPINPMKLRLMCPKAYIGLQMPM